MIQYPDLGCDQCEFMEPARTTDNPQIIFCKNPLNIDSWHKEGREVWKIDMSIPDNGCVYIRRLNGGKNPW